MKELEISLAEADTMVNSLDVQITTLETLKEGEVPEAPAIQVKPIDFKEPEIKTVEVSLKPNFKILACFVQNVI